MIEYIFKKYLNFKNIMFVSVLILFLFFIFNCKNISIMFFASFVIACSLNPLADKLEKKMSRGKATCLIMGGVLVLISAIFIPLLVLSFQQINAFFIKLPAYIDNLDEYLLELPVLKQFDFLASDADTIMENISLSSADLIGKAVDTGKNIGSFLMYLFVSLIIIFNLVEDKENIKNFYLHTFPKNMRKKAAEVGEIITDKMGGYLTALLATSASVGIVMLLGLFILQVPYASLLSLITAVFDIVPVIGPAVALVLCIIASYESGTAAVISVIAVFALAQIIENNFVRPYVFGKVMNIHPIVIFLFMFIAAEYIGVIGVIFAPALAALFSVLFEELYMKKLG